MAVLTSAFEFSNSTQGPIHYSDFRTPHSLLERSNSLQMASTHTLTADHLHAISRNLFVAADTPRHIADTVAKILVNANLAGHDSHGLLRMPWYLKAISDGSIKPDREPTVAGQTKTTLLIDGQHGMGIYTARKGPALGLEKVKESELCCVTFLNIGHIISVESENTRKYPLALAVWAP